MLAPLADEELRCVHAAMERGQHAEVRVPITLRLEHDLKREAFEKWRTGYSSAYAIILFVTVFGLASIYVKALNKVKER